MSHLMTKEKFTGGYDGASPPSTLLPGEIAGGKNIRWAGNKGGWKPRLGYELKNTTPHDGGVSVDGLFAYTNPKSLDFRLIIQAGGELLAGGRSLSPLLLEPAGDELTLSGGSSLEMIEPVGPLVQTADLGTSLGVTVGTSGGYDCLVEEDWFFVDGSGRPIVYGGDAPYCEGFLVYDNSETAYNNETRSVIDEDSDTYAILGNGASDVYYVAGHERLYGLDLSISTTTKNTETVAVTIYAWRSGAWASVGTLDDGTAGTETHDQSGEITWSASALDEMKVISGKMSYWYRVTFSAAISTTHVTKCKVKRLASRMTNKWSGIYEYPQGVMFFDAALDEYQDVLGRLTSESELTYLDISSATTSDFLYIKGANPLAGVGITLVAESVNTDAAVIDNVEYWNGFAWTALASLDDGTSNGTSSFAQTGKIFWDFAAASPRRRKLEGDPLAGYWYRISWAATLSTTVHIYLAVIAEAPTVLGTYEGCFEFRGALFLWGDKLYPNRLKYSTTGNAYATGGISSNYTKVFGNGEVILRGAAFGEYALVLKKSGVWLMDQDLVIRQVTTQVGICSPTSLQIVEVGTTTMQRDKTVNIAMWEDIDGVYQFDLTGVKKISLPVNNYFDIEHTDFIGASNLGEAKSFNSIVNSEYHLLFGSTELVYNYAYEVWYPIWERALVLSCGISFKGLDKKYYSFAGTTNGLALHLDTGATDKDSGNDDVVIEHSIKTRGLTASEDSISLMFLLRALWFICKTDNSGGTVAPTVTFYKNLNSTGIALGTIDLTESGQDLVYPFINVAQGECVIFQIELTLSTEEKTMEIYELLYEAEIRAKIK